MTAITFPSRDPLLRPARIDALSDRIDARLDAIETRIDVHLERYAG